MNKKHLAAFLTAMAAIASCSSQQGQNYSVAVNVGADAESLLVYLEDYDSQVTLDSVTVENGIALFEGSIESPIMVRAICNNKRVGTFVLEGGTYAFNPQQGKTNGGELNLRWQDIAQQLEAISNEAGQLSGDSVSQAQAAALYEQYVKVMDDAVNDNGDNPVGLYFFMQNIYGYDKQKLDSALQVHPAFAQSKRVSAYKASLDSKEQTSVGHKYKDFEIEYDGQVYSLSQYVKPGEYTLVDFWASWCGPCRREIPGIKELYKKYGDKGLNVVGIAVWDAPENTLEAIEQLDIPWPVILNAQKEPTDLYGIQGIPCIILIGPDGTILSRDKQGAELASDVIAALES